MAAPHNHTPSSKAAAAQKTNAATERKKVLAYARNLGTTGSTNEEASEALGVNGNTLRPRRWELVDAGQIVITPKKRQTKKKRNADVWVHHKFATQVDLSYTSKYLQEKRAKSRNRAQSVSVLRKYLGHLAARYGTKNVSYNKVTGKLLKAMDRLGLDGL